MIKGTHLSDQEKGHSGVSSEQNLIGNTKEGMEKIVNPKFRQKKKKSWAQFILSYLSGNSLNCGKRGWLMSHYISNFIPSL